MDVGNNHRVHRVAMTTYFLEYIPSWWKISLGWWGWGVHYNYHHVRSWGVRSSWEGRYTPPVSYLPLYILCDNSAACAYRHNVSPVGTVICLIFFSLDLYATSSLCPYTGNLSEQRKKPPLVRVEFWQWHLLYRCCAVQSEEERFVVEWH
jgi:hypothetical protein